MRDSRTIITPSIVFNYEDNLLESVAIGGEPFYRKQRDWHAIARSYEQTIERMGAENAKLRELVAHLMYVKPNDVNAILYKGKLLRFDDLLADVGMRWESEVES